MKGHSMNRKFKTLGVAFVAVLAMTALAAASAQAHFSSAAYPAVASGEQTEKHEFTTVAGTVKCSTANFTSGSISETSSTLTVTPEYKTCTIAGIGATVNMNGCDYVFSVDSSSGGVSNLNTAVNCPGGSGPIKVNVTGSTCEIQIGAASNGSLNGLTTTNASPNVTGAINVTGITYTVVNGNKCPNAPASGSYSTGSYKGGISLSGNNGTIAVN
jgi:hypothetical protein